MHHTDTKLLGCLWMYVQDTESMTSAWKCHFSILHIYCTVKPGGGGKPNLVGFNPYTYWTQKRLLVYLVPCGKNWDTTFMNREGGCPKINKIRGWAINKEKKGNKICAYQISIFNSKSDKSTPKNDRKIKILPKLKKN